MTTSKYLHAAAAGTALIAAALASSAFAGTATGTLTVNATVLKVCLISNGTLNFGNYNPTATSALNGSTTVTLTCTPGSSYNIAMNAGSGSGATTTLRQMTLGGGSATLGYALFQDSGYSVNWGTGSSVEAGTTSTTSLTNTINVYGQIPANEVAGAGSYTDSVTMTVTY
jgi:spore coat protein U domain-containing protein, fimbrial subunit CupE1/2/3/6